MNLKKLKNKNILIIGSDGTIGSELFLSLKRNKLFVTGTTRRPIIDGSDKIFFDLSDKDSYIELLKRNFDYVFICVGISNIKQCEKNPKETRLINVIYTVEIAKKLGERGTQVIYISSTRIFNANINMIINRGELNPNTEYGKQKAECEILLKKNKLPLTIIRMSEVIDKKNQLFNNWVNELKEGRNIYPYYDFKISPISCEFAINSLQIVICSGCNGIINLSASHDISYADAIFYIANNLKLNTSLIKPISYKDKLNSFGKKYATLNYNIKRNLEINRPDPFKAFDYFIKAK